MMNKLAALLLAVSAAGCATENDGALHISGQLTDASRVTHVVATNPTTGERVVVDLKSDGQVDGRFSVALPSGGGAWIVTFVDGSKKGAAMRVATLQSAGLDAFSTKDGGAIEFGKVSFSGRYAHGTMTWDRLSAAFGESRDSLVQRAKFDDIGLRYSNPDIDNNGEIDALENHAYRLDINGSVSLQTEGRDAVIADLVQGLRAPSLRYLGTTIQAEVPDNMGMNMFTGTVQFEQPFYGTALGSNTPMVEAGTRIGQPHVKFGELFGAKQLGVVATGQRNAPNGTYRFGFDKGQLTFTDVVTPSIATLSTGEDYAVPFVRIRATNASCVTDCDISSIDLEWMRQTSTGWQAVQGPADAHLDILAGMGNKRVYLAANLTDGATSQPWSQMPLTNTGLVRNELSYITSSKLCYLAVSYTSELGMKMTSQVKNPSCF
jgi:hypothetical protein